MYKNINFDRSYARPSFGSASVSRFGFREALKDKCLNDNQVVRIIFKVAEKTGIIPNTLDMSFKSDYPQEVQSVLDMLNKEFPAIEGFKTDREAFDTIKSRYLQSAGELQQLVDDLSADFIKSRDPETVSVDKSAPEASEYGTDV